MSLTAAQVRGLQALAVDAGRLSSWSGVALQGVSVQYRVGGQLVDLGLARACGDRLVEITDEGRAAVAAIAARAAA